MLAFKIECMQALEQLLMQTTSVNSQKAGSGKTMPRERLATEAERAGDGPASLINTGSQGSLIAWRGKLCPLLVAYRRFELLKRQLH